MEQTVVSNKSKTPFLVILCFSAVLACLGCGVYYVVGRQGSTNTRATQEFIKAGIPQAMESFPPQAELKASWGGGVAADFGNELKPSQVHSQPNVSYAFDANDLYTVLLTDIDVKVFGNEWLHWLVYNVPGVDVGKGDVLNEYVGSLTGKGGFHRYVLLAYRQMGRISPTEPVKKRNDIQRGFDTPGFARRYGLGAPLAGNYYLAQYEENYVDSKIKEIFGISLDDL